MTVGGERVAAIVLESVIEVLYAAEDADDVAEANAAVDGPGESIPWAQVMAEFELQARLTCPLGCQPAPDNAAVSLRLRGVPWPGAPWPGAPWPETPWSRVPWSRVR
jgi:hypothetical protein